MPLIDWAPELNVAVSEVDRQHQQLVAMINELADAMSRGQGKDAIGEIVSGLADYARDHFALEEKYFQWFDYSDSARHISQHREFLRRVATFQESLRVEKLGLPVEIHGFMWDWLRKHIQNADKKYVSLFHANGIR